MNIKFIIGQFLVLFIVCCQVRDESGIINNEIELPNKFETKNWERVLWICEPFDSQYVTVIASNDTIYKEYVLQDKTTGIHSVVEIKNDYDTISVTVKKGNIIQNRSFVLNNLRNHLLSNWHDSLIIQSMNNEPETK